MLVVGCEEVVGILGFLEYQDRVSCSAYFFDSFADYRFERRSS